MVMMMMTMSHRQVSAPVPTRKKHNNNKKGEAGFNFHHPTQLYCAPADDDATVLWPNTSADSRVEMKNLPSVCNVGENKPTKSLFFAGEGKLKLICAHLQEDEFGDSRFDFFFV